MDYEADVDVSFSQEALEILANALTPELPSISPAEDIDILNKYRYCSPDEEATFWQSLEWNKKICLFHSLDPDEKVKLLSLRSPDDLKQILLRLPHGELFELKFILERLNILPPK